MKALLSVHGLRISLPTASGLVTVVDGVDFEVGVGQVFGIAGESGSGKTISVLALLGLLPEGARVEGTAVFDGQDLLRLGRIRISAPIVLQRALDLQRQVLQLRSRLLPRTGRWTGQEPRQLRIDDRLTRH